MNRSIRLWRIAASIMSIATLGGSMTACQRGRRDLPLVEVYKSRTCSCCAKWIRQLEGTGFRVESVNLADLHSLKARKGIPSNLRSYHTATVDGYVVEGHVPAEDIKNQLSNQPKVLGFAVPEMPIGSPGMESADRSIHEDFDVISFGESGAQVFASHRARN